MTTAMDARPMPAQVRYFMEWILRPACSHPGCIRAHVVPLFEGRKSAAWAADTYRVTAYHVFTGDPLEPAAKLLSALPGCREVTTGMVPDYAGWRRPAVIALMDPELASRSAA